MSVEAAIVECAFHVLVVVLVCPSGFAHREEHAESISVKFVALVRPAIFVFVTLCWVFFPAVPSVAVFSAAFLVFFVSLAFLVVVFVVASVVFVVASLPFLFFLVFDILVVDVVVVDVVDCFLLSFILLFVVVHIL